MVRNCSEHDAKARPGIIYDEKYLTEFYGSLDYQILAPSQRSMELHIKMQGDIDRMLHSDVFAHLDNSKRG
ncbi:Uncharacterised protein [Salmonella enterica]|uniref:Uncharacterized protein n=1 Tax=Salmonella enterica TaxID=28901 RepID=A0A379Q988_SALER|nr:Uncharacterised protein [Salmonella enterica]